MAAAAELRHERRGVNARVRLRGAARDLHASGMAVEQDRHAHPRAPGDLLDEAGDVLVARRRGFDVVLVRPGPDEPAFVLTHEPREREAPELERLEPLVPEYVVGDRLQVRAMLAELRRAVQRARIGARELERARI